MLLLRSIFSVSRYSRGLAVPSSSSRLCVSKCLNAEMLVSVNAPIRALAVKVTALSSRVSRLSITSLANGPNGDRLSALRLMPTAVGPSLFVSS